MGQDIETSAFRPADFRAFAERLKAETALLTQWFEQGRLAEAHPVAGFELEAWLTDPAGRPVPLNERLLERLDDAPLTTELARFNFELNTEPRSLAGDALGRMEWGLEQTWRRCRKTAAELGALCIAIGILPTVRQADLGRAAMTPLARFAALNEQVLRHREGRPLRIDLCGRERLRTDHRDIMLESAATSFQVHMQVPASRAGDYYNAALLISAPIIAASANSPFLFGRDLWDETRIPLFEQAVESGGLGGAAQGPARRVGFGTGSVRESLLEVFKENLEHFPVLLPMLTDDPAAPLGHLQLQNGTIWRWNRPLVGIDTTGEVHLRIEHRVIPGGPSARDSIANAALFYGLAHYYAGVEECSPTQLLAFPTARDNFYASARHGLGARVRWTDGAIHPVDRLILRELLPCARIGLRDLGLDTADIDRYLGVIEQRTESRQTGAAWQRAWIERHGVERHGVERHGVERHGVERHGRDMQGLTLAYSERQTQGDPVHEWPI